MLFSAQSLLAVSLAGLLSAPIVSAAPAIVRAADGIARRNPGGFYAKRDIASVLTSFDPATELAGATTTVGLISQAKTALDAYKVKLDDACTGSGISKVAQLALKAQLDALITEFTQWANSAPSDVTTALKELDGKVDTFDKWVKAWLVATPGITSPSSVVGSMLPTGHYPVPTMTSGFSLPTGRPHFHEPIPIGTSHHHNTSGAAYPTGLPYGTGVTHVSVPLSTARAVANPSKAGVAAWWGQSPQNVTKPMSEVCADASIDTVILSFITTVKGPGGYPMVNISSMGVATDAQTKAGATGLGDGKSMVADLEKCKTAGKKVMISIGGEGGDATFTSDAQATAFADTMWNLFLGGTDAKLKPLRPFGDFVLDGVDIDNESKKPAHYVTFVKELRKRMKTSTSKTQSFKISAAPQCARAGQPNNQDASLPDEILKLTDYVWVQFYNNKESDCNHGEKGFIASVKEWSKAIEPAQLWIGAPASTAGAGSGYIAPAYMKKEVAKVKGLGLKNFGGYALWSASLAMGNGNYEQLISKALAAK